MNSKDIYNNHLVNNFWILINDLTALNIKAIFLFSFKDVKHSVRHDNQSQASAQRVTNANSQA